MAKARCLAGARRLEEVPNIGPAMADDLRALGIETPAGLRGKDAAGLYLSLCRITGLRQDPCVLDTFIAAVAFAANDDAQPWWAFTEGRKALWPDVEARLPACNAADESHDGHVMSLHGRGSPWPRGRRYRSCRFRRACRASSPRARATDGRTPRRLPPASSPCCRSSG